MNPLYIYMDLHNALSSECSAHLREGSQSPPACENEAAADCQITIYVSF